MVSHGELARALLQTATEIVGPFEAAEAIPISRRDSLQDAERALREAIQRVDQGRGALVLVDMFGGSAANVALALVGQVNIEVVTGCNLPMLLKLSSAVKTEAALSELAQLLKLYGKRHVLVASEVLKEREQDA